MSGDSIGNDFTTLAMKMIAIIIIIQYRYQGNFIQSHIQVASSLKIEAVDELEP